MKKLLALLLIGGAIGGIVWAANREEKLPPGTEPLDLDNNNDVPINDWTVIRPVFISKLDTIYDYKYESGKWYTKKKVSTEWLDMQARLSTDNFNKAVAILTAHLNAGGK